MPTGQLVILLAQQIIASETNPMKLSLFWKLMLSFALVVAVGLSVVVLVANQVTNHELHEFMMDDMPGLTAGEESFGLSSER